MMAFSCINSKIIKSSLYSLNSFLGVTSEWCFNSVSLRQGPHIKVVTVTSRWQRVDYLIGSGFEPHTSRTRSRRLTTRAVWPVSYQSYSFNPKFDISSKALREFLNFSRSLKIRYVSLIKLAFKKLFKLIQTFIYKLVKNHAEKMRKKGRVN